ncbi:MAG: carbohydrate kinase family protein [Candidatus Bathyarchaeota archaeon]|nr:carbohydrate kinase family protein [Candidatus Bathyarchaeota archaeon]
MTRLDVIGFGALNVDKLFKVNHIAHAEQESFIQSSRVTCGGSAANTIVGLARLGCKVGFIGKTALDREGELLLEDFLTEGVDTLGVVRVKDGESGSVMGFVDQKGQRALYINSGVNDTITLQEIREEYVSQAKFLHLTSFVGEQSFQTQKKLLEKLEKCIKISFDPGALYAQRGYKQLAPLIEKVYVILPNIHELEQITEQKDPEKGAALLQSKGVEVVAVKLGDKGCYVTNGDEHHYIEAVKVPVVDTTGAGDAFNAGFLYGLLHKKSLLECGKLGNFVASCCIKKMGARAGLPYKRELELL